MAIITPKLDAQGWNNRIPNETVTALSESVPPQDGFEQALYGPQYKPPINLLQFPSDLYSVPEYSFGVLFEIYDTGGQALAERRKKFQNISQFSKESQAIFEKDKGFIRGIANATKQVGSAVGTVAVGVADLLGSDEVQNQAKILEAKGIEIPRENVRDTFVEEVTGLAGLTEKVASVNLFLPGAMSFKSQFDYEDADLSAVDIVRAMQNLVGQGNPLAQGSIAKRIGLGAIRVADEQADKLMEKIAGDKAGKGAITNYVRSGLRQIENPFLVQVFKGVGRRKFTFEYVLVPRSEEESLAAEEIVRTFRKYSHPKRVEDGRFLDFPAEFDITFKYNAEEVIRMPKIGKCALVSVGVDYGEKIFTAHKDTRGQIHPTMMKLSLEFSEMELLARDEIDRGY